MNALEHYREAERLLAKYGGKPGPLDAECAQAHATLALAGITAMTGIAAAGSPLTWSADWLRAVNPQADPAGRLAREAEEAERAELAHDAEEDRKQRAHDEMIDAQEREGWR
jgi:hypothetical protein